MWKNLCL